MAKDEEKVKKGAEVPPTYRDGSTVALGDEVHVFEDGPLGFTQNDRFEVVAINDPEEHPGKLIGLKSPIPSRSLHSLDGQLEENRGWWTRPEHLVKAAP